MTRYVAFLRGVSPMNAKMPDLKRCVEAAGMTDVRTVLSSGNVVFTSAAATNAALERKLERAMERHLGRTFDTIVRQTRALQAMLDAEPHAAFALPAGAKRIVTFLRTPVTPALTLPHVSDGVHILAMHSGAVYSAYEPNPRGPVFMTMLERAFGKNATTRTWDTVKKCAAI